MHETGPDLTVREGATPLDDPARLELILQRVADGITVQDRLGRLVYANEAAARMIGFGSAAELLSTPLDEVMSRFELLDEDGRPLTADDLPGRRALLGGADERLVGYRIKATRTVLWSIVSATPVFGADGQVEYAVNVFRDITARRDEQARLSFLARAGEVLSQSLDYERTLAEVARQAVPTVADWCMVYVQDEGGTIRRIAVEHFGGLHLGMLDQLAEYAFDPDADIGVPAVIRSGEPQLHPQATSSLLASDVLDADRLAVRLDQLGIRSWMCVPLTARGRTFGAMSFLASESARLFGPADLDLAQELARRAAVAVDNARLYQQAQESVGQLEAVLASAPVGIGFWDTEIRYVRVNETLASLNGLPAEEHVGKTLHEVIPDMADALYPVYRRVVDTGEPMMRAEASTDLAARRLGDARHWLSAYFPVKTPDGTILGVGAVILEITDRKRAEEEASRRARQQADVAALGQLALAGGGLDALLEDAVTRLTRTLDVEYAKVLELQPAGDALLLRAGIGWSDGLVGRGTVGAGLDSQAGYTLSVGEPVIVADLRSEERFAGPALLHEHGVVSGMSAVVEGRERPYGVLGVHSSRPRTFAQEDVNYLQSVANVVAAAVEQERLATETAARARQQADVAELGQLALRGASVEALMTEAAERLARTLEVDFVEILELDSEADVLRLSYGVGWHEGLVGSASVPTGRRSQGGFTLQAAGPVIVEDLADETRFTASPLLRQHNVVSGVTVMIAGQERPYGALGAHTATLRRFTHDDVNYLQGVANVLAVALDQWRLRELERSARERLRFLAEAGDLFSSSLDLDEILKRISRVVVPRVADACNIFLSEGDVLSRVAYAHAEPELERLMDEMPNTYSISSDSPPVFLDVFAGEPLLVSTVDDEFVGALERLGLDRTAFQRVGSRSMMFVPFVSRGETLGVITLGAREPGRYAESDLELARDIARRAASAIENARLYAAAETARREAESRAQAAQALRFVGDGVVLLDRHGVIRLWNPAAETITRLRADVVVGRRAEEAVPGWAALAERVPIVPAADGSLTAARPETLPIDVDGRELWLSISGVGFDEGTVFAFRDVTEERGVEQLKSEFVSTISHELRTPLAAIYGAALTLRREDMPADPDQRSELLAVIAQESERLARIVNDILWTSRIESGALQLTIEEVDPHELAKTVVQSARLHAPENLALELDAANEVPNIAADPDKVRQVLANLVENAIKYSPDGGTVRVGIATAKDEVCLVVSDEGLGIPRQEQERIFEKFYRLDPNLTRGVGGTGLGLYICRELIHRMGGRISVESEEARGSTFTVRLPAAGDFAAHRAQHLTL